MASITTHTDRMPIDRFQFIGMDIPLMAWLFAAGGALGIVINWLSKKPISFAMTGLLASGLVFCLIHLPFPFLLLCEALSFSVGGYFDSRRRQPAPTKAQKIGRIALCAVQVAAGIFCGFLSTFDLRHSFVLTSDTLTYEQPQLGPYFGHAKLARQGLQVSHNHTKGSSAAFWDFEGGHHPRPSTGNMEFYIDSSGHVLSGDDVGRIVAKWAHVTPTEATWDLSKPPKPHSGTHTHPTSPSETTQPHG